MKDIGAVLLPLIVVIQEELQMVLVPLEFGSVNLTGEVLAGACRVDEESLHERVWLKVKLSGRAEVRRIMFEICLSN
jgi:hypothetical protein